MIPRDGGKKGNREMIRAMGAEVAAWSRDDLPGGGKEARDMIRAMEAEATAR
jgi:hypothetical protein